MSPIFIPNHGETAMHLGIGFLALSGRYHESDEPKNPPHTLLLTSSKDKAKELADAVRRRGDVVSARVLQKDVRCLGGYARFGVVAVYYQTPEDRSGATR